MATNDNAISCNNSALNFWDLVAASIGKEASGKKYLRTHIVTAVPGSKGLTCGDGINTLEDLLASVGKDIFCYDANGDIAIRISQTT